MKIRKYIYSLLIGKTIFAVFIFSAILWIMKSLKLLDIIAIKGVNIIDFLKLSLCLLPYIIYLTLPFAMLLSLAIVYKLLDQDNELLILKLSGMKKSQLIAPFLEVFAAFSVLGLLISIYLIPVSYQKFQDIIFSYQNYYLTTFIDEKSFNSDINGITFYINKKDGNQFEGIFINDHRSSKKELSIFAESGEIVTSDFGTVFRLYNGMRFERALSSDNSKNSGFENSMISSLKFEVYNLVFDYKQALKTIKKVEHRELKVTELLSASKFDSHYNSYISEGIKRLLWPCLTLILSLIFLSVAINAKFSRKFRYLPAALSFILPFLFILLNIYFMSFAHSNWRLMYPILFLDFIVLIVAYCVSCNQKMSFRI